MLSRRLNRKIGASYRIRHIGRIIFAEAEGEKKKRKKKLSTNFSYDHSHKVIMNFCHGQDKQIQEYANPELISYNASKARATSSDQINDSMLHAGSIFTFRILILQVIQNSIGDGSSNKQEDSWSERWIEILDKEVVPCFW